MPSRAAHAGRGQLGQGVAVVSHSLFQGDKLGGWNCHMLWCLVICYFYSLYKILPVAGVWQAIPVIPTLGRWGQDDQKLTLILQHSEFKACPEHMDQSSNNNKKLSSCSKVILSTCLFACLLFFKSFIYLFNVSTSMSLDTPGIRSYHRRL